MLIASRPCTRGEQTVLVFGAWVVFFTKHINTKGISQMAAPKAHNAYELLLQALQGQNRQDLDPNFSLMSDSSSPGGLLGRLLTAQAAKNSPQSIEANSQLASSGPGDSNFRQLARLVPPQTVVAPSIVPDGLEGGAVDRSTRGPGDEQYAMGQSNRQRMSDCVDQCIHLLSSPSGDLQSSEFRQCVGKCMGRL